MDIFFSVFLMMQQIFQHEEFFYLALLENNPSLFHLATTHLIYCLSRLCYSYLHCRVSDTRFLIYILLGETYTDRDYIQRGSMKSHQAGSMEFGGKRSHDGQWPPGTRDNSLREFATTPRTHAEVFPIIKSPADGNTRAWKVSRFWDFKLDRVTSHSRQPWPT
jgi:hypothetical protein